MIVYIVSLCMILTVVGTALICSHLETKKGMMAVGIFGFMLVCSYFVYAICAYVYQVDCGTVLGVPKELTAWFIWNKT